ncbi:MAG: efflux RND transporter permease subunit [Flexistipes sinusarabici]|uniref:Efflux RND transporter permease subunit n=1 Tax=Flexistipes sinusarabici TaxID=2352 RepID=A0A5D0MS69_FLESI|nr:efflux RND transporter permease subunit [Flexistipes sinusarabici]TYB33899.1 MAG: efflux RND transporter permease subunit [Flexistipes sinusarabici]
MSKERVGKGPIAWMAKNSVAANILMIFLLIGGLFMTFNIKQEVFPEFELDTVAVTVAYPGASPDEIEKGVILPVEEAIEGIDGIKEIRSTANENSGTVTVEAVIGYDLQKLYQDIKNEVDRIDSFPTDAEEPQVFIPSRRITVTTLVLYGNQSKHTLKEYADIVKNRLIADDRITVVEIRGANEYEIKVDVSEDALKKYDLTLPDIASKIDNAALDLPAGTIETSEGDILVRLKERKDYAPQFEDIPVVTTSSGTLVKLGDIASVTDGFEDTENYVVFNGKEAIELEVFRVGNQKPGEVAKAVNEYVKQLKETLPSGLFIEKVRDRSEIFEQRVNLLLKNGLLGLGLVMILLSIFLELRLAFWVAMGILISFLGSFLILPVFGVSINMISLFAFIITLGIVVDDAIVVGENIYTYRQKGIDFISASIRGAREIAMPVCFSVLTNMVAFLPMYFIPGVAGKIFGIIPIVVVSVFAISLVESLFILPAHLGHQNKYFTSRIMYFLHKNQQKVSRLFEWFIRQIYHPLLRFFLKFRYISITASIGVLIVTMAFVASGRMGFAMFPKVESDFAYLNIQMPLGTPDERIKNIEERIFQSALKLKEQYNDSSLVENILVSVNENTLTGIVFLAPPEKRVLNTAEFVRKWRKELGSIPDAEKVNFQSDFGGPGSGADLTVELSHQSMDVLEAASSELADEIGKFDIASDIEDGFVEGKDQFDVYLKPKAYFLGLTPQIVARDLRSRYYGAEALKQLRGKNELTVMVRLNEKERKSVHNFNNMKISTPTGVEVPLSEIADVKRGKAYTSINRRDGRRIVSVTADVDPQDRAVEIVNALQKGFLLDLMAKYPGLSYSFEGKQSDIKESVGSLMRGLAMALLAIYVILAIPFKSYIQPIIIMCSIPFGIIGAVYGHLLLGYSLSLMSLFGIVALAGVVVNDTLVLIDYANRLRRNSNYTAYTAIIESSLARFRPVFLTTFTTFFGLIPMIFETSRQARFLIPMAISLGFGILFALLITLVFVPSLYVILEDLKNFLIKIFAPTKRYGEEMPDSVEKNI